MWPRKALGVAIVLLAFVPGLGPASGQTVDRCVSSKAGDRLTAKPPVRFEAASPDRSLAFQIDEAVTRQTMVGFGASFLEAGIICLNSLPPADQESVLRALFDPVRGAGFTAMKTPLAGTDFMSARSSRRPGSGPGCN